MKKFWLLPADWLQVGVSGLDFEVACRTEVGLVRSSNEDAVRFIRVSDPALYAQRGVLAVVADGMGGHQAGEVASALAVDVIGQNYFLELNGSPESALNAAFADANRAILNATAGHPERSGMGTTGTALAICGRKAYFAHVGDTRLYRVRGCTAQQLTHDHTEVGDLLRAGMISANEARYHPFRNVITRALGTHGRVEVDSGQEAEPLQVDDAFLLCSDGLHDLVTDEEFGEIIEESTADGACNRLVDLALSRGGHDNISVLVIRVVPGASLRSSPEAPITRA